MNGILLFAHSLDIPVDQWLAIEKTLRQRVEERTNLLYLVSAICLVELIVIAILVTSNYSAMLPTIVSRCQYLKLANVDFFSRDIKLNVDKVLSACNLSEDDISSSEMVDVCINFVNFFESNGMDTLLNLKKIWYNNVTERKYYNFCFQIIIYFYYDVLKYKFFGTVNFFNDSIDNISSISDCLDVSDIVFRIQIFLKYYDLLKYNLNLNLLMDRVVIELGEVL